jgi:hypothetical protein
MVRLKTYDATGVAPNGRLFAGDLNLLQDTVAALLDYTQNIGVGTIAIGDSSLSISKYGAGELQVSNMLRVLGVFRAASGIVSGSYTTTARDALVNPDYGLVILNSTTNQYEWNSGTPSVPVWTSLGGGGLTVGADGAKGAASAANKNKLYFSTDVNGGTLYGSTGVAWQKLAPGLTESIRPARHAVKLRQSVGQVIADNAYTIVNWDTEDFDTDAMHSVASNTHLITIPFDGLWRLELQIGFVSPLENGLWGGKIVTTNAKDGVAAGGTIAQQEGSSLREHCSVVVDCVAGDTFYAAAYQNHAPSPGNLALAIGSGGSWFSAVFVSL